MPDLVGRVSRAGIRCHPVTVGLLVSLLPVILLVVDVLTPPAIRFGSLMVAAPALAAVFCTPVGVLIVIAVTLPCVWMADVVGQQLGVSYFVPVQIATIVLVSAAALAASAARLRKERQLARSRWVAEVTQRVLLHPLPHRVGRFDVASLYLAADEEAAIGGDLYAFARGGTSARILLGDAQGKGLASLEMVSCVLNTFRQSVRRGNTVPELVHELEAAFRQDIQELSAAAAGGSPPLNGPFEEEAFVTAVVLDLPDTGPLRLANLGHPPPLLVHEGNVTVLDPTVAVPPLGLGDLIRGEVPLDTVDFPPGATLLLYTDGVSEARGPDGVFYPLEDRLTRWTALAPDALLAAVHDDLREYVGARLTDDVAMVAVRRPPSPVRSSSRAEGLADVRRTNRPDRPARRVSRFRRRAPSAATPRGPSAAASPAGP
ncbi:PP2C family protein-serine/threonine phosphatase [Streptomyces caeni]|uniref:PP2C family protein-serine/threonine phosphatase n=1 Tax=Streptomyces caeni TaxID=2307231 RepID=A0ABW4IPJ2_9ACTN